MPVEPVVSVPAAQLAAMQADLAKLQQLTAQKEVETLAANAKAQVAAGQSEQLARQYQDGIRREQERAGSFAKQAELRAALASKPLTTGAVDQLSKLWGDRLVANPTDNGFAVRESSTFQDVHTFVNEQLNKPEWSHFLASGQPAPPNAAVPASQAGTPTPATTAEVTNYGQATVARFAEHRAAALAANPTAGDPRLDKRLPMGLGKTAASAPERHPLEALTAILSGRD